jgi:hypothetical protein
MNNDLISREALIKKFLHAMCHNCGDPHKEYICGICQIGAAGNLIKSAPAVDAVEVVRCYQCKYYLKSPMICEREDGLWTPDKLDYCSFGERRDGE